MIYYKNNNALAILQHQMRNSAVELFNISMTHSILQSYSLLRDFTLRLLFHADAWYKFSKQGMIEIDV